MSTRYGEIGPDRRHRYTCEIATHLSRIFTVLLFAIYFEAPAEQLEFEVAGDATQLIFAPEPPGTVKEERRSKFRVTVKDCQWVIQVSQLGSTVQYKNARWLDYETFSDGTNNYTVGYFKQSDLEAFQKNPELKNFPRLSHLLRKRKFREPIVPF